MKKIFIVSLFILFVGFIPHVFAGGTTGNGFVALAPIPGLTQGTTADAAGLANFFNNLYKYLIGIAAILAVIEIIWGGLEISTQDSVSKHSDGKERITQAIFGLVLVLSPVLVFSIINPSILNLSLNLPQLNTPQGAPAGMASGADTGTAQTASGCTTISGVAGILQFATCPSNTAAQTWCSNGQLSQGAATTNANGVVTSQVVICGGSQSYVFIYLSNRSGASLLSYPNSLYPLAVTDTNPNNGSQAVQFQNTCQGQGMDTCISSVPTGSGITCSPTPSTQVPQGTSHGCFTENLSCQPHSSIAIKCSSSPGWISFQ